MELARRRWIDLKKTPDQIARNGHPEVTIHIHPEDAVYEELDSQDAIPEE